MEDGAARNTSGAQELGMKRLLAVLAMGMLLVPGAQAAKKAAPAHANAWVGSWAAAPMVQITNPAKNDATMQPVILNSAGSTYRDVVHLSIGGDAVRLKISNEFGDAALNIGSVHVAMSAGKDAIELPSDHAVTFGNSATVMIPPGAMAVSDPISMPVAAFANLAVSIYLPSQSSITPTYHGFAASSNYIADGNATAATTLDGAVKKTSWYLLKGVDVETSAGSAAIVTFGDSITDGAHSTFDTNSRWPDVLAARLHANPKTANIGVLNEGIGGNRLLHDFTGSSALERLDRDVLAQSGAKYVIIMLGINDIGRTAKPRTPDDAVTLEQLKWAWGQLALRAHARGLKVYAATLTPYVGAAYQDAAGEKTREALNDFIRTSKDFDAVIDFDKVTRDPAHPDTFLPAYDSGDHLHPGDAGYKAMGEAIDLRLFQ